MTWLNPTYFFIPSNKFDREQIIDWVRETLEGHNERGSKRYRWSYYRPRRAVNGWGYPKTYTEKRLAGIEIADDEDAIAYKLMWGS